MSKNINILILDSDDVSSLRGLLENKGYSVCVYSNLEEAVEYARNNLVHIAILDITMPRIDGNAALGKIKDSNGLTQIIATGAYATTDRVITAMENGANDFILKPFENLDHVVSIVEESEKKLKRWQTVLKHLGAL